MDLKSHLPLIAILRGITPAEVDAHVAVLIECGFELIEIPANSPRWRQSVESALKLAGTRALIGAGTVLTLADANALADTGARLMVTPNTDAEVIAAAVRRGLLCAAGFATPSEAFAALKAGAQALKLFPAIQFGTGYVRALKAVLPSDIPLFAVGGITPANLPEFLDAGCHGAGLGSDLYKPGQAPETTRARAQSFIDSFRNHHR
jgi:2-dehydro-3-deoxyphosphogalactonate aldolase